MSLTKVTYSMIQGEVVNVLDFGAVGDGTNNDTTAFQAAIDSLGDAGGTVFTPANKFFYIGSNLTVKPNVTIKGPFSKVGSPKDNTAYDYTKVSAIRLNSAATITLKGSAGIDGVLVYKNGMTFPIDGAYTFAGTAVTVGGDDAFVINSMILGFDKAIYSSGYQRLKVLDVNIDCMNGVHIDDCLDIARLCRVQCWPFAAVGTAFFERNDAFRFSSINDWGVVIDCFSWGYLHGFYVTDCSNMRFIGCGADNSGTITGSIGFLIAGTSHDTIIDSCNAAAQDTGIYVFTDANYHTQIIGAACWSNTTNGIVIETGDATVVGSSIRTSDYGIAVASSASNVLIDDNRFYDISVKPINSIVVTSGVIIGINDYGNFGTSSVTNTNIQPSGAVAASTLLINSNHSLITVSGTTTITNISGGWAGREITLLITSTVTLSDNPGSMNLNGNFNAVSGNTIKLVSNGTEWFEVSRSPN